MNVQEPKILAWRTGNPACPSTTAERSVEDRRPRLSALAPREDSLGGCPPQQAGLPLLGTCPSPAGRRWRSAPDDTPLIRLFRFASLRVRGTFSPRTGRRGTCHALVSSSPSPRLRGEGPRSGGEGPIVSQ